MISGYIKSRCEKRRAEDNDITVVADHGMVPGCGVVKTTGIDEQFPFKGAPLVLHSGVRGT